MKKYNLISQTKALVDTVQTHCDECLSEGEAWGDNENLLTFEDAEKSDYCKDCPFTLNGLNQDDPIGKQEGVPESKGRIAEEMEWFEKEGN